MKVRQLFKMNKEFSKNRKIPQVQKPRCLQDLKRAAFWTHFRPVPECHLVQEAFWFLLPVLGPPCSTKHRLT